MGFNKVAVSQFFALLAHVIDENKLTGAQIYNCDETAMTVVPKQHSKIIATKGQRQPLDVAFMRPLSLYYEDESVTCYESRNSETERANDIPIVPSSVRPVELTTSVDEPEPLCSEMPDTPTHKPNSLNSSFPSLSPENAMPVPKVKIGQRRVARKRGKQQFSLPAPTKHNCKKHKKPKVKQTKVKRKLLDQEKIGNSEKQSRPKPKKVRKTAEEKDEDTECFYCNELYSTSNEGWVSCVKCKQWAHNSCAGTESDDDDFVLICETCKV
ncbi:hypothetical protein ANN_15427 [Periplaneta americana]|uniref:Zinc finger PHD-type domain-containing protein n=1 Tax=Periplaneta americana TaxID=6978 RepID=A0ABQ8SI89_PERAM|nr:hypothetical protein ANN_15427 [Periplaneta americana]